MKFAVLIPTYNESMNVGRMLGAIDEAVRGASDAQFAVYVLDDNSPDATAEVARDCAETLANVDVQILAGEKRGLGAAYRRGFEAVLADGSFDYAVQMDCDFSHPVSGLLEFVKLAENGNRVIVGSRYVAGGKCEGWSRSRLFVSVFGNFLVKAILGRRTAIRKFKLQDVTGGFNCYSTAILKDILNRLTETGYTFQIQTKFYALERLLFLSGNEASSLFAEFPINFSERQAGVSKIPTSTATKTISLTLKLRKLSRRSEKPCCA